MAERRRCPKVWEQLFISNFASSCQPWLSATRWFMNCTDSSRAFCNRCQMVSRFQYLRGAIHCFFRISMEAGRLSRRPYHQVLEQEVVQRPKEATQRRLSRKVAIKTVRALVAERQHSDGLERRASFGARNRNKRPRQLLFLNSAHRWKRREKVCPPPRRGKSSYQLCKRPNVLAE